MPSFLNKVFGLKKHDDKEATRPAREASSGTLLDGKYEAIPPVVSPASPTFSDSQQTKDPDRDVGFSLFKPKHRGASQKSTLAEAVPHLTLQLPGPKGNTDSRTLSLVFEADPESQTVLDDAIIAAKRLNPLEALMLVRACSQAIIERGLETLGIMHPHWFSASRDVQRKLISLFIRSLTPPSRKTTLSPTSTCPTPAFENELHYTRSSHDVAAVLRWGLRHLSLENGHFGKDSTEWAWYNTFFQAERNASYPPKAFSELLLPQLPASHAELLTTTLRLISSLASHAEVNSISGSKLSKFIGLWLLAASRADQSDDWNRFYARWERAGRILEHLFLARLREESIRQCLPTRLQELVKHYPYKGPSATEDDLLSRPRFSTRQYDALFVRVETLLTHGAGQPRLHPIQLLLEAFQLPIENPSADDHIALWSTLKTVASEEATPSDPEGFQFTRIFVDETIQLLSLIPIDNSAVPTSPTLLTSPITKVVSHKRSSSPTRILGRTTPRSNANSGSTPVSPTSPSSPVIADWAQFSLSGFGDTPATQSLAVILNNQDDDVEVTQPRISRKSSRRGKSRSGRWRSEDQDPSDTPPSSQSEYEQAVIESKLVSVHVVQIDEAFIDFWSDAIVDPISANWPTFVICGLKQIPSAEQSIRWLVIEQTYSRQQPQPPRVPSPDGQRGRSPRPSFRSDMSGFRINSMFTTARKRFSLFSKSVTDLDPKRSGGKTPIAGELGEVLVEEEPAFPSGSSAKVELPIDGNAAVGSGSTISSGATAVVADQLKVDEIFTAPSLGVLPADLVPAPKEQSGSTEAAVEAPSVPPPQSGRCNDFSALPRSSARTSEEAVSAEQCLPRTLDVVNAEVNAADPNLKLVPLAADTSNSRSTQDSSDPSVFASTPAPTAENFVPEIQAGQLRQNVAVEVQDRLVEPVVQPADGDERLPDQSTGELSNVVQVNVADGPQEVADAVAMPPVPETVAAPVAQPVVTAADENEVPEPPANEPRGIQQPSRNAPVDLVAASTIESVGQHEMDDLSPVSATDKVTATETGAQLEPDSIAFVGDAVEEAKEVAEFAEIPTPAPEIVALVEETPSPDGSVEVDGCASVPQSHSVEPESHEDGAPQLEAHDDAPQLVTATSQAVVQAEEPPATIPAEPPSVEIAPVVDASVQVLVVEPEHAADHVAELATEEAHPPEHDNNVPAVEAPMVEIPREVEADISACTVASVQESEDVVPVEAEAQVTHEGLVSEAGVVKTQDTGSPTPAFVDETPGPEIAADAHGPVEAVEDQAPESVEVIVEVNIPPTQSIPLDEEAQPLIEAEPSTQVPDRQPAAASSAESVPEAASAALVTEDADAHTTAAESGPLGDTVEVTTEASEPDELAPSNVADSEPVEDKAPEPVIVEAQVLVEDAVPSASELIAVAPTVIIGESVAQAPIEASSEPAPQSVDEAADPPSVVVSDTVAAAKVEAQLEYEDAEPAGSEPVPANGPAAVLEEAQISVEAEESSPAAVESQPDTAALVVENDERSGDLVAEQPVTSEINVVTHEPAGLGR